MGARAVCGTTESLRGWEQRALCERRYARRAERGRPAITGTRSGRVMEFSTLTFPIGDIEHAPDVEVFFYGNACFLEQLFIFASFVNWLAKPVIKFAQ